MIEASPDWSTRLAAWRSSGKSGSAWCRDNGIGYHQFIYWRDKLQPPAPRLKSGRFIPLTIAPTTIRLECNGVSLLVSPGFDPHLLRDIICALREC